ncbi:LOB domain-containing protein 27 [Linum perenne]
MTLKGGTSHACAACKYQRRKCTSECQLAPYFPANRPEMFRNAHKLFGVRNIVKILEKLDANQRQEAMHSIIWEANIRHLFPVDGCVGYIFRLQRQIHQAQMELDAIHAQLQMYRHQHQHQHQNHNPFSGEVEDNNDMVPSQLELGMAPPAGNALALFSHDPPPYCTAAGVVPPSPVTPDQQHSYSMSSNNVGGVGGGYSNNVGYLDTKEPAGNSFWLQHTYGMNNSNNNNNGNIPSTMALQSQMLGQPLGIQQEVVQDYDENHPFFDTIDDRQSYIDSKEAYDTSSEESLKDTTQSLEHVAENELKSAAACFSLTSVN